MQAISLTKFNKKSRPTTFSDRTALRIFGRLIRLTNSFAICYTNNMVGLTFEWDEDKNKLNQKLHSITFEDAKFVFNDPNKVILPDLYNENNS